MKLYVALVIIFFTLPAALALTQVNYTTPGSTTYTVPAGVRSILIETWGAGGGGMSVGLNANSGSAGGGGGAYAQSSYTVTAGQNFTVTVGAGGAGSTGGFSNSTQGGSSSFTNSSITVLAEGGFYACGIALGGCDPLTQLGGRASASTGQIKYSGGNGSNSGSSFSGGGGGAASSGGTGGNASATTAGTGASGGGGNGGTGRTTDNNGQDGSTIGGGGSGAYCDASCAAKNGGNGARGEVRITEYTTAINVTIVNANTLAVVNVSTNISFIGTYQTYTSTTSTGSAVFTPVPATYVVRVEPSGYGSNQILLTTGVSDQNITVYVDNDAQTANFAVRDTLDDPVEGATVTFSRGINGSIVTYAQIVTDFSGLFSLELNPSVTYAVSSIQSEYAAFTGNVQPSQSTTYVIRMQFPPSDPYQTVLESVFYEYDAEYINATLQINVTWEVTSLLGNLETMSMQTSYNGVNYNSFLGPITTGGIINITIPNVNLSVQNQINVTFNFAKADDTDFSIVIPFYFQPAQPGPASITGGFCSDLGPTNIVGRAILATIILIVVLAAVWKISGSIEAVMVAAILVIGLFAIPACQFYPLRFALISIGILVIILIADAVTGR